MAQLPIGFTTPQRQPIVNAYYYAPEYFSGCDVRIYIGDVYVDEAMRISFELQEKRAPIYGYASVTYDALAQGTRIVQGWFDIAFRRVGYLTYLLAQAGAKHDGGPVSVAETKVDNKNDFDLWAQAQEEQIWGRELTRETAQAEKGKPYEITTRSTWGDSGWADTMRDGTDMLFGAKPIDIVITYGEFNGVTPIAQSIHSGWRNGTRPNLAQAPLTVNTINEVSLLGFSKMIESSGAPIVERYAFIAKDVNRPVSRA